MFVVVYREMKNRPLQASPPPDSSQLVYRPLASSAEEDWDADGTTMTMAEVMSQFYALKLHEDQISFVHTLQQLQEFYTAILQPGTVIGFDSEWRPGSFGKQER
jgi:hypothetical protein